MKVVRKGNSFLRVVSAGKDKVGLVAVDVGSLEERVWCGAESQRQRTLSAVSFFLEPSFIRKMTKGAVA